jgi:D-alanyl-D-alanine carboxypeptidase/D-alanyl-D-alanine-endopeptidase (penicillin-binding protein 4)
VTVRRAVLGVVALLVLGGGGAAVYVQQDDATPTAKPSPTATPVPTRTPLLAALPTGPTPTAAGLRAALRTALASPALGSRVSLSVVDADGKELLDVSGSRAVTPASTTKIATAIAALTVLSPDLRLRTRVVAGAQAGDVVLVGGGDPTLGGRFVTPGYPGSARLADLARQLTGTTVRRVLVDDSLYVGSGLGPGWKPSYVTSGNVAPVSALEVDSGRAAKKGPRSQDPALAAGRQLAALLHVTPVARAVAPAGAKELAHVDSPPVRELVESMLTRSDNDLAEALGRQVALASKLPASFAGAAAGTHAALEPLLAKAGLPGSSIALRDSSGLSPLDRVQPVAVAHLLAAVSKDARYGPLLTGLPIAGFDGTLAKRYRTAPNATAAGLVRAKTGTLNGVSALAGLVATRSGGLLAFDVTADGVPLGGTLAAEAALDRVAAVLSACGCT